MDTKRWLHEVNGREEDPQETHEEVHEEVHEEAVEEVHEEAVEEAPNESSSLEDGHTVGQKHPSEDGTEYLKWNGTHWLGEQAWHKWVHNQ